MAGTGRPGRGRADGEVDAAAIGTGGGETRRQAVAGGAATMDGTGNDGTGNDGTGTDGTGNAAEAGFDPDAHAGGGGRWFEDFELGERFPIPSRTLTAAHFSAFQAASGDNHPIHYDVEYCRARGHRDLLAHGYQVVILGAAGAGRFPFEVGDALVAFLSQESRFRAPVYVGDTLYPMLELIEKEARRTTGTITLGLSIRNQHGELCLDGRQTYLVRRRPAAAG